MIFATLVAQLKDREIGVLITDHNVRETLDVIDRAYIIHDGMVLLEGAQAILSEMKMFAAFIWVTGLAFKSQSVAFVHGTWPSLRSAPVPVPCHDAAIAAGDQAFADV